MRGTIGLIVGAAFVLSACSMAQSTLIAPQAGPSGLGCRSAAAAYYLPKTYFSIKIDRVGTGKTAFNEITKITPIRRPDRNQGYCLDYLTSPTAEESMQIKLDENFLLRSVASQAVDQSGYIIKKLIGAVFQSVATSQGRRFGRATAAEVRTTVFEGEWDPVNPVQSAVINAAIKDFGFCIITASSKFDVEERKINSYCNDPLQGHRTTEAARDFEPSAPKALHQQAHGILYRPRVPHAVYLFINPTPLKRAPWQLGEIASVHLENEQTVVSVGVDRAFFATRKTALVFDEGALKNICIHKSSELVEVSTIPLTIAKNLAALPGNVLQLKLENTNNHAKLIEAEQQILKVQESHIKALQREQHQAVTPHDVAKPPASAVSWPADTAVKLVESPLDREYAKTWNAVCSIADKKKPSED